jgi:beta-galactosidase
MKLLSILLIYCFAISGVYSQNTRRESINFNSDWRFAFGHPYDTNKDFGHGTSYFSYLAKTGYGDGPASPHFNDAAWRQLDLPHDWAVEAAFDAKGSHSHGYKAIGRNFPESSVGWYRKTFSIDKTDLGKQIYLDFDGVMRDSKVWVNGHFLGTESSGYLSFSRNISELLNYGGDNIVSVRVDVSIEEGWYYEGAGIYRHVWLRKLNPVHIPKDGTFVHCKVMDNQALVNTETLVANKKHQPVEFYLRYSIRDGLGKEVCASISNKKKLAAMSETSITDSLLVNEPKLWSLEEPYLYDFVTQVVVNEEIVDTYITPFGIRTIHFDAKKGFFLNGKHVKLKGTNNHQNHAGVGSAIPNELQKYRLLQLKSFGCNAYRASHNPPTPELLDLCDRLGILVINENRLMGTTAHDLNELERLMRRDRNHPSVIMWSIGNEEWAIEGNEKGARIAATMQAFAKKIDPTRPVTKAISGGRNGGILTVIEVMGSNYLAHGSTDEHHQKYPNQPFVGTEEGSTFTTRGIYFEDKEKQYLPAYDLKPRPNWYSIQECWKHYASRDYLAGMFIWTGFDYRGEPTPFTWPSVLSYFGMMDLCGFPKDNVFYLKSWWQQEPVLHILPHWNWKGKENQPIDVWVYSNCEQVELFLNGKSLGKKAMQKNGHLEWKVNYQPGTIKAVGFLGNKRILVAERTTTNVPVVVNLSAHKTKLVSDNHDIAVITVQVLDKNGLAVPTASSDMVFTISGPGKIIGVGNGDPTSHEREKFIDHYRIINLPDVRQEELSTESLTKLPDRIDSAGFKLFSTSFVLDAEIPLSSSATLFYRQIGTNQRVFLNGKLLDGKISDTKENTSISIDLTYLKKGENHLTIIAKPLKKKHEWDIPNKQPGTIQIIQPAENWSRKLFNGLAQVIVQAGKSPGQIVLHAVSEGMQEARILIEVK